MEDAIGDMELAPTARYLEMQGLDKRGKGVGLNWKVLLYTDGPSFWELRDVLESFYFGSGVKWETGRVIKEMQKNLKDDFAQVDMQWWHVVRPSVKSYKSKKAHEQAAIGDEYLNEEHTMGSAAIFHWLCWGEVQCRPTLYIFYTGHEIPQAIREAPCAAKKCWGAKPTRPTLKKHVFFFVVEGRTLPDPNSGRVIRQQVC